MRCAGEASRSFISGIRLWPPASSLASSPSWPSSVIASSRLDGLWYSNAVGITIVLLVGRNGGRLARLVGGVLDGVNDVLVARAAAEIAVDGVADLRLAGVR